MGTKTSKYNLYSLLPVLFKNKKSHRISLLLQMVVVRVVLFKEHQDFLRAGEHQIFLFLTKAESRQRTTREHTFNLLLQFINQTTTKSISIFHVISIIIINTNRKKRTSLPYLHPENPHITFKFYS